MITQSQTQKNQDENKCPNKHSSSSTTTSLKSPPLKSFSSIKGKEQTTTNARKKQRQQQKWPSVKSLRENYEPRTENVSLEINGVVVEGGRRQGCSHDSSGSSSGSSRSAYRRQNDNRNAGQCRQKDAVGVGSKYELRSNLRRVSNLVETTVLSTVSDSLIDDGLIQKQTRDEGVAAVASVAKSAKSSSEHSTKEDAAAITKVNGSRRIKEESANDEEVVPEPTMVQLQENIVSSSTILSCPGEDDDTKEVNAVTMTRDDVVGQFEGCRLKSTQTVADNDEDYMIDDKVVEDEEAAVMMKKKETDWIQLQEEEPAEERSTIRIKEEEESAVDVILEPTMVQEMEITAESSPFTLPCYDHDAGAGSKHEMRSELRRADHPVEMTTLSTVSTSLNDNESIQEQTHDERAVDAPVAKSASEHNTKEDVAATTEVNGPRRIKDESDEEVLEPKMVQLQETIASSPTTLSCPGEDDAKEVNVNSMTQDVVGQFERCRLKSTQTVADDGEEDMINDVVVEEEPAVMKKETDWIHLQEEPAAEKKKNPRSSNNCEEEIIPTNSTSKTTVLVVKSESSTTSSIAAKDILHWVSRLILSGLSLFGMYHRYTLVQATSSQGPIEDSGSPLWHRILHVGLVFALFVKAAHKSTEAAVCKQSRMQKAVCFMRHLMFWTVTIPLFHKCSFGDKHLCFFPTKMASQLGLATSASACIPNYSIFDVAVANSYHALLSLLKTIIKSKLLNQVYREIQRALFNPFKFHARVQKALVILKWAKFFGPLIGTCNKFRGNLMDMAKKRRQHRVSKAALKRWYFAIDALSKQSKSEQAVVQLQKAFRERRVEKTKKRQLLMANRRWVRSKLEEEERLNRTKLEQIERRDIDRQQKRQVSSEERHGIVQHKKSARKLMKQLLLNPKTHFSVIWKYLTVSCVALEIMTIVFAPALSGEVKKMPLDQFIVKVLRGSRPQCNKSARDTPSKLVPLFGSMSDITCSGSKLKQTWYEMAHVIATMLVPVVNWICFLDVFITCFTGELSSTGTLEPKPFFQRWVLPGPVLQLIVNPTMTSIKIALCNAFGTSIKIGPSLCLHCFLAWGVFAAYLYDRLFECILDIVEKINEFNAQTKGQDDEDLHWT